jgi:hypothetical protein
MGAMLGRESSLMANIQKKRWPIIVRLFGNRKALKTLP